MSFTKRDFIFSIITGLITGFVGWRIMVFLGGPELFDISFAWLLLVVPALWILGINLGYFLGRWLIFFNQFGRFTAVGFTNAAVDFGFLNLLIAYSGIVSGIGYSLFKGISFVIAVFHSYVWNKYWVFESGESHGGGTEFIKFFVVTGIALLVNVGIASFVVNVIDPLSGIDEKVWANIGAVAGSAVALVFSFVGFRLVVFKKKEDAIS